jgi:hypothetical protein
VKEQVRMLEFSEENFVIFFNMKRRFTNRLSIVMDTRSAPHVKIEKEVPMSKLTREERISTAELDRMTLLESLVTLNEYMEEEFGMSNLESLDRQIDYLKNIRLVGNSSKLRVLSDKNCRNVQ